MVLTDEHPELLNARSWRESLAESLAAISAALDKHRLVVVGVTGAVGSGKTTFADALRQGIVEQRGAGNAIVVSTDHYLPDYTDDLPVHERDLPHHADIDGLVTHLHALRRGEPIQRPIWSFHSHRREGTELLAPPDCGLILVEGIHALVPQCTGLYLDAVYVHTPVAVRRHRFTERDRHGERGMTYAESQDFFDNVADPTFMKLAPGYLASASLVVDGASMGTG